MDAEGLTDALKGMQNDPELLAAFAEAQAELEKKSSSKKTKKKKKKKKVGDQLAELEMMMSKLEDGEEMDLETAAATLKMLEEPKKSKKKKIKKEKLPAPFSEEPSISEVLKDIDLNDLSEEHKAALENFEPTPEEIEAEFQKLKAEQEAKKAKKVREKKKAEKNLLRDEDGNILLDENGQPLTMDDPELLAALLEEEDDEEMKAYIAKQKKKSKKKKKTKKVKREEVDPSYEEDINPDKFMDEDGFGWKKKDANKKLFKPKSVGEALQSMPETEEEKSRRLAREAGEEIAPADVPVPEDDFGPTLPESGIPARAETGAIPGGSKLKPIEDDDVIEARLRQKALEKAIQDRLDKRLMRQKRIEVRLASWIGKQQSLKNEAKQIAEERLQRAQEITEAMAPGVAKENEAIMKNRNQIVAEVRDRLREEVSNEVRREIEEEENRKMRRNEKAPEAPKVPAAVMDAIQMSDAWEQFWKRYKAQLQDWSHWDEEQEEYHKQAAGWYFTQGFIQSQVVNNAPKAPDEDPSNIYDPNAEAEVDPNKVEAATTSSAPVKATSDGVIPPPAPKHSLEEEERLEKLEKKKTKKLQKYDELLKDPIFDPNQKPKYMPWGARDGEVRVQPGYVPAGIAEAPQGATFAPKSAIEDKEKVKLDRMKKMLAIVRGPEKMKSATYGTSYLPTQDDALQFIKLERFRRDRHRMRSSDQDSETDTDDEDEKEPRQRGARSLPYMPKMQYGGTEDITTTTTIDTSQATNVNQPGEMINPAGEALQVSSSDSSDSETEEQKDRRLKMAAKFNPAHIYGESTVQKPAAAASEDQPGPSSSGHATGQKKVEIRRFDGRTETTMVSEGGAGDSEAFSFDFLGGEDHTKTKPKKLYDRSNKVPKYLPQDDAQKGPGFHKEGPLKGLPKHWKQEQGLRQRPREDRKPQFVEVSEDHLPPQQLDLPEYVQDVPEALPETAEEVKKMATMAVRDYQREHMLMQRKKTRMEEYMERRNKDKRFAAEAQEKKEEKPKENVELFEESLDFDPASFFGKQTGGMFTKSKVSAVPEAPKEVSALAKKAFDLPKEGEKPKTKFSSFGASWKKKQPTQINTINLKTTAEDLKPAEDKKEEEELPDFLKEQEKLFGDGEEAKGEDKKDDEDGFGWGEKSKRKRKGTEKVKRKFTDDPEDSAENPSDEKKSKKSKKKDSKFQASWMKRMGEDPDKPLREADAGMEIDESELRTYNDGNPKPKSTTEEKGAGDRDDRDWGAWKPRSRQVAKQDETRVAVKRKEGEISELHKKLLDPARFDYDPDFARAGSLQFMHPLQCSKVLGRPYPEDLQNKGQKAFDDDITAYREPAPIQDPSELGPEPPPDGAIFWGVPEEVLTDPRLVVLKVGIPENCPGPEPRGWLDGLKRRKWYEKAQAPEIRPIHPASYFKKGDQLHQDKTFGVFYHPKYYGKTKEEKMGEIQDKQDAMLADSRASLAASFQQ